MSNIIQMAIINDPNISEEQRKQEIAYKNYVDEHIYNVKQAWFKMRQIRKIVDFIIREDQTNSAFIMACIDNQIQTHDASKYSLDEWEPYRKNFNPVNAQEKEDNIADFERAWNHHYMCNLHHWNFWYLYNQIDKMPLCFVVEMCCDWIAMSMKFGGNAVDWYLNEKLNNRIHLGEKQEKWTLTILKMYYNMH